MCIRKLKKRYTYAMIDRRLDSILLNLKDLEAYMDEGTLPDQDQVEKVNRLKIRINNLSKQFKTQKP